MKYPKATDCFPNHSAFMAWMFGQLGASYSLISQYEIDEEKREREEFLNEVKTRKPPEHKYFDVHHYTTQENAGIKHLKSRDCWCDPDLVETVADE